jgi:hypothetical protein
MERKLTSIRKITDIRPIEGADAIETAMVGGWTWKLSEGGKDPYTCHECGYVN